MPRHAPVPARRVEDAREDDRTRHGRVRVCYELAWSTLVLGERSVPRSKAGDGGHQLPFDVPTQPRRGRGKAAAGTGASRRVPASTASTARGDLAERAMDPLPRGAARGSSQDSRRTHSPALSTPATVSATSGNVVEADDGPPRTLSAAEVRQTLGLTHHQLSELTAGLVLDIGPRPNYPRYTRQAVTVLTCVVALRETKTPLDVSMRAAHDYRQQLAVGSGWLLVAPRGGREDRWTVAYAASGEDLLAWIENSGGRGTVLDLRVAADRAERHWQLALAAG